jgi:hypothetical protein
MGQVFAGLYPIDGMDFEQLAQVCVVFVALGGQDDAYEHISVYGCLPTGGGAGPAVLSSFSSCSSCSSCLLACSLLACLLHGPPTRSLLAHTQAIEKLTLNDASVVVKKENSEALGPGFRAGFLGMLHMEVFMQRLEQE